MGKTKPKTNKHATAGESLSKIWNNKDKIYNRMKELSIMAENEKELNLEEEYNKSKNEITKLNERHQELQMEEHYEKKRRENGDGTVNFQMINEASEVALKRDDRWKNLGYIHKKVREIKEELKKEMNARDHHEAKKILDRYESRHAILLHMRAKKEDVITSTMEVDLSHDQREKVEEKDRLINVTSNSEEENGFIYENVSKEIDEMSDTPSKNSNKSNDESAAMITQETPTKRRRPVVNPYSPESKPKPTEKAYKGWKSVIEQNKPGSPDENEKKRPKTTEKHNNGTENNKENTEREIEKTTMTPTSKISYSKAVIGQTKENANMNETTDIDQRNSVRVKYYFHALPAENESSSEFITTMLIHLSECTKTIDPKARLITWEESGENPLNAKEARLLSKEKIMKYISIPGNPTKLVVGRTYYQVGIRIKTNLTHVQFIAKWNNARYNAQREQQGPNWIAIKAAEVQDGPHAYAVGYFAGTTERGDYDTIQAHLQEQCQHPIELSYQLLNQTTLTKNLWKEARASAEKCDNNRKSRAYKSTLFKLAPAALTVYVYKREHIKETKHFLMEEYGEALDDGTWPILQDGSRSKFIPLMKRTPKRKDVQEYLEESMVNQIHSKSVEISIRIDIRDIKEEKEYLRGQSIEQILHKKISEKRENVPIVKHVARRWTAVIEKDDSYELIVQPNMFEEAQQYIKTFRNTMVKEYGTEITQHFWAGPKHSTTLSVHNGSQLDASEDEDEILISKLKNKKDTYSKVLVEGMEIVLKDIEIKEKNRKVKETQNQQNESQNEMSGLTSIREETEYKGNKNEEKKENDRGKQVSFQDNQKENNESESEKKKGEENKDKIQEENASRMSGFTSVLENNSLITNLLSNSKERETAEKLRRSREIKVKNTLAQFNVSSSQIVEWTSKNPKNYQEFSNQTKHDEYNTLKLVIKAIIKKRTIQEAQNDSFNKMMVLSNEKARECQQNDKTLANHPNQLKSPTKPKKFKKWGQQKL